MCGIEKEEECYLRMEPLSCEWSKKTARFSLVSCLLSIGLFSPFSFFFDSLVSGYLSFIFSPFFSSFTIRLELLLQGGWSGVRSVFGRLHYSVESIDEFVGSIPVHIGDEFFSNLIMNCIIIGTGIDGWIKSRVNITADAEKSVKL